MRFLYWVLPKVFDVGRIARELVLGNSITSWMPIWSSALFGVAILSTGLYVFARRNY